MTDSSSETSLDARLRAVPLPGGLLERLRHAAAPSDEELDGLIQEVPVREGILERVRAAAEDELLDEGLRAVSVPPSLAARLRVIPHLRPARHLRRWAVAATLMLLLGGGYLAALLQLTWTLRPGASQVAGAFSGDPRVLQLEISLAPRTRPVPVTLGTGDSLPGDAVSGRFQVEVPAVELDPLEPSAAGPADVVFVGFEQPDSWWTDVLKLRWNLLGAPHESGEDLPELEDGPVLRPRGVELPARTAEERLTLLRDRTHPPLLLERDESLRRTRVPLSSDTASVERTRQLLSEGRLPRAWEIHVEDFLAEVPYQFPPPDGAPLAIRTAAGPHPFGHGQSLLLLGLQATREMAHRRPGTHLTLAIDVSESMRWEGRLARTREALLTLLDDLLPQDRLSLVAFNEGLVQVVEQAGLADRELLRRAIENLRADGGTNLGVGLQQAVSLGLETPLDAERQGRLVLVTDGQAAVPPGLRDSLRQLVAEAAAQGLKTDVLDLGQGPGSGPLLEELAAAGEGRVGGGGTTESIRWRLLELLTGHSTVVAEDAVMRVEFNPAVVRAYRLVGHEPNALAMVEAPRQGTTVQLGQSLATLLEVWLLPGSDDLVGWVELEFREPGTSGTQRLRQRISRLQFAPSFQETPLDLQAAAIVAEAAQVLRGDVAFELAASGGYQARTRPNDWQAVLEQLERAHPSLAERAGFTRLTRTIRELERVGRER